MPRIRTGWCHSFLSSLQRCLLGVTSRLVENPHKDSRQQLWRANNLTFYPSLWAIQPHGRRIWAIKYKKKVLRKWFPSVCQAQGTDDHQHLMISIPMVRCHVPPPPPHQKSHAPFQATLFYPHSHRNNAESQHPRDQSESKTLNDAGGKMILN